VNDILSKLKAGRAAVRRVTLPRKDGQGVELGLRILTEGDYLGAGVAAIETLRGCGHEDVNVANAELFEAAKALELLARADKAYLIEQYLEHEREYSPGEANMNAEDFAQLLEEVKKNPATPRLSDSSSATLKRLVQSLAAPDAS
jgi:hypothetical protein